MLTIGLTGGIGCGKSTVAKHFAQLGVPVIDADEIARDVVAIGQPALQRIQLSFGDDALNPDGSLNRDWLRERVFTDAQQRQRLEAIVHPLIYQAIWTHLEQLNQLSVTPYCIVCLPLLFETRDSADFIDRVLVIDCPIEEQIARVQNRDGFAIDRIKSIINSQVSRIFRLTHADDVIDNSVAEDGLAEWVKKNCTICIFQSATLRFNLSVNTITTYEFPPQ